jgi:hypothetical protein
MHRLDRYESPLEDELRDAMESVLTSHPRGRNAVLRDIA